MAKLKLSIIIPTYNSAKTIRETIKSIVLQNVNDIECLLIDGGSRDETLTIIKEYDKQYPWLNFISEPDKGIYDAMNKGIVLAKGDYLYFMGSDDVFYNDKIISNLFALPSFGNTDFIYGDVLFKHSLARVGEEKHYLKLMRNQENICHQSIFYSRNIFHKLGNYNLNYPIYADFHMNIRCFRDKHITKKYINTIICVFNEKGTSFFYRNNDRYLIELHEEYVQNYVDPVAMHDTIRQLEGKLVELLNSKEYRLGKKIADKVRGIKAIFRDPKKS